MWQRCDFPSTAVTYVAQTRFGSISRRRVLTLSVACGYTDVATLCFRHRGSTTPPLPSPLPPPLLLLFALHERLHSLEPVGEADVRVLRGCGHGFCHKVTRRDRVLSFRYALCPRFYIQAILRMSDWLKKEVSVSDWLKTGSIAM